MYIIVFSFFFSNWFGRMKKKSYLCITIKRTRIMIRKATCTDGITRTFTYNGGTYYVPYCISDEDKKDLFKGFPNAKACVLYTEIVVDSGSRIEMRYGSPCYVEYNNGQVGYQNGQFFNDVTEAEHDYNLRKQLSAKVGTIGYCDVQLVLK